jgi:hypothetical protein
MAAEQSSDCSSSSIINAPATATPNYMNIAARLRELHAIAYSIKYIPRVNSRFQLCYCYQFVDTDEGIDSPFCSEHLWQCICNFALVHANYIGVSADCAKEVVQRELKNIEEFMADFRMINVQAWDRLPPLRDLKFKEQRKALDFAFNEHIGGITKVNASHVMQMMQRTCVCGFIADSSCDLGLCEYHTNLCLHYFDVKCNTTCAWSFKYYVGLLRDFAQHFISANRAIFARSPPRVQHMQHYHMHNQKGVFGGTAPYDYANVREGVLGGHSPPYHTMLSHHQSPPSPSSEWDMLMNPEHDEFDYAT